MIIDIDYCIMLTQGDDYFIPQEVDEFATSAADYEYLKRNANNLHDYIRGKLCVTVDKFTTVSELWEEILPKVDFGGISNECKEPCFFINNHIIYVLSKDYRLDDFIRKYTKSNTLKALFIISNAAGDVFRDDGLRYYFNSHEAGKHHIPHIHVDYLHEKSGVYSILTGERIKGDIPRKIDKIIKKRIINNQRMLAEWWNNQTDGIDIDLNHEFGYRNIYGEGIE